MDLGFAEHCDNRWLRNLYFPSKLGGKPAWLELDHLPTTDTLLCSNCQKPKIFLCQIYAPFEDEHNFHRTIYVFICRNVQCQQPNQANNLTVLRSQLPRANKFYSVEPPVIESQDENVTPLAAIVGNTKLCDTCGCMGPLACSRCKTAHYCCVQHQRDHWLEHKKICCQNDKIISAIAVNSKLLFAELEIVIEIDDTSSGNARNSTEQDEAAQMQEFDKLVSEGKAGTLADVPTAELDKFAENSDDKHFRNFKKLISAEPEQVIRYKRNGQPLWITDVAKTVQSQIEQVPNCEACGGARQFEFQIMPQTLNVLKEDQLDWGVLVVYTCAVSCRPAANIGYLPEYIVKQDIVQ